MHMGFEQTQSQRLDQTLVLAPRMIQSMEVLQMSVTKLEERIQEEMQDNPVMELVEAKPDDSLPDESFNDSDSGESSSDSQDKELVIEDTNNEADFDRLEALNRDWQDHFNEEHRPSRNSIEDASDKKHDAMQNLASRPESLRDHLREQLDLLGANPTYVEFAQVLIDNLDDKGYLSSTIALITRKYVASLYREEEEEDDSEEEDRPREKKPKKRKKKEKPFTLESAEVAWSRLQKMNPEEKSAQELQQQLLLGDPLNRYEPFKHLPFYYLLIEELNEQSDLPTPLELLIKWFDPELPLQDAESSLRILQQLDPPGVGARDLQECLLIQMDSTDLSYPELTRELIVHHLEDIQHNRLPNIQRSTGADLDTIQEAIDELKHLNPRPAAPFSISTNSSVVPDVAVDLNEDGEYEVRLLDDWIPDVFVPGYYREMVKDPNLDEKSKDYLRKRIQRVDWLHEAIEQRRSTLKKVTEAIIHHQRAFFDKGEEYIEPLKMQQIAEQVGVHVTTVSRAVDKKYAETPRGVFPLKRFFGGGREVNGHEVAYETIKRKLQEIVDNEDKSNPLSDDALVKELEAANHPIKRRTVTKYRKMLGIPSSRERKDWSLNGTGS